MVDSSLANATNVCASSSRVVGATRVASARVAGRVSRRSGKVSNAWSAAAGLVPTHAVLVVLNAEHFGLRSGSPLSQKFADFGRRPSVSVVAAGLAPTSAVHVGAIFVLRAVHAGADAAADLVAVSVDSGIASATYSAAVTVLSAIASDPAAQASGVSLRCLL